MQSVRRDDACPGDGTGQPHQDPVNCVETAVITAVSGGQTGGIDENDGRTRKDKDIEREREKNKNEQRK